MSLTENVTYLKSKFPRVLEKLQKYEYNESETQFQVEVAKNGDHTLYRSGENNQIFVHSKYNPIAEAKSIISKYEDIDAYEHVLFYGLGLGYHITEFKKQYPKKAYSIYEPSLDIFHTFVTHKSLEVISSDSLKALFIEQSESEIELFLNHFLNLSTGRILFIPLPSYERIFVGELERFTSQMSKATRNRISHLQINLGFEKRWIINGLKNFTKTIENPSIFSCEPGFLKDKPVLLVAAGPSLQYEVENIKKIKEQGLAYIFTVGSGVKALLSYGIHPDFACTYDPQPQNQFVFDEVIKENITSIPLIYGTSVGFETLDNYPGPLFHMITSQDTVASYYFANQPTVIERVSDAASIAIITIQMLSMLGANPIILVGQNFAYNDGQFYATGVKSRFRSDDLTDLEKSNSFLVEDVEGGKVYSNTSLTQMKSQMEEVIKLFPNQEFVNTTIKGAKIKGTTFTTLENLLKTRINRKVVEENLFEGSRSATYDKSLILEKVETLDKDFAEIDELFKRLKQLLSLIEVACKTNKRTQLKKLFPKWDKAIRRLRRNDFYNVFLQPMNRVSFELLLINIEKIKFEDDLITKGKLIFDKFGKYINECLEILELFKPIYTEEHEAIVSLLAVGKENNGGL